MPCSSGRLRALGIIGQAMVHEFLERARGLLASTLPAGNRLTEVSSFQFGDQVFLGRK